MFVMMICIAGCGTSQKNDTQEQTAQNSTSAETSTDTKAETNSTEQDSATSDKQDVQESNDTVQDRSTQVKCRTCHSTIRFSSAHRYGGVTGR